MRVHFSEKGHPLVGDDKREEFVAKLGRKTGRILSVLPGGGTKKQRHK